MTTYSVENVLGSNSLAQLAPTGAFSPGDAATAAGRASPGDGGGGSFYFEGTVPSSAEVVAVDVIDAAVTDATNTSPIVVTANAHGLWNGQSVLVQGVVGNPAANGTWLVANVTTNTFELVRSQGNGAYTSGGTVSSVAVTTSGDHNLVRGQRIAIGSLLGLALNGEWEGIGVSTSDSKKFSIPLQLTSGTYTSGGIVGDNAVSVPSQAAGVTGRWLRSVSNGLFNALWFGFDNTGAVDNTKQFNMTLDYLKARGGGTLFFPAGTYRFESTIGITPTEFFDTSTQYDQSPPWMRNVRIIGQNEGGGAEGATLTTFEFYGTGIGLCMGWNAINNGDHSEVAHIRFRGKNTGQEPKVGPNAGTVPPFVPSGSDPSPPTNPAISVHGRNYYRVTGTSALTVKVKITATGPLGTCRFQYSLDGGTTYSDDIQTFVTSGYSPWRHYRLTPADLTVSFPWRNSANTPYEFTAGNIYTFAVPRGEATVGTTASPSISIFGDAGWAGELKIKITAPGTPNGGGAKWALSVNGGPFGAEADVQNMGDSGIHFVGDRPLCPEQFHPTRLTVYFPDGTYQDGDLYSYAMQPPAYNHIGVCYVGTSGNRIHDCNINGFKYQITFEGTNSCVADSISGDTALNEGYFTGGADGDGVRWMGEQSSAAICFIKGAFPYLLAGYCNNNAATRLTVNGPVIGTLHDDGIGHWVHGNNYAVSGTAALVRGGMNISIADCTGEGMRYAGGVLCTAPASSGGGAAGSMISLKNTFFATAPDVPGVDATNGTIRNISLENVQIGDSPNGVVVGNVVGLNVVGYVGRSSLARPIQDRFQSSSGSLGTAINFNRNPQAALDVSAYTFANPLLLLKYSEASRDQLLSMSWASTDKAWGFTRVRSPSAQPWGAAELYNLEHAVILQNAIAADFASINIPTDNFVGRAVVYIQAVNTTDPSKVYMAGFSRRFYRHGGAITWLDASPMALDTPINTFTTAWPTPTIGASGTDVAISQGGGDHNADVAFFHRIESCGW